MSRDIQEVFKEIEQNKITHHGKGPIIDTAKKQGKLLGVKGRMDYIHQVVPFCYCSQKDVVESTSTPANLKQYNVILVGCPGQLGLEWISALQTFVTEGGYLVTTDWSLRNLLPAIAPGYISVGCSHQGMYEIRFVDTTHPFLEDAASSNLSRWEVEYASELIRIDNTAAVKILIDSPGLIKQTGYGAIMVTFPFGKGCITHFVSHVYLQKGTKDDKYAAAFILTNIIDEAIRVQFNVTASRKAAAVPKIPIKIISVKAKPGISIQVKQTTAPKTN